MTAGNTARWRHLGVSLAGLVAAVVLAAIVTVSPDGVAFTSVAEQAGSSWAGRALGAHSTAENLSAAAIVPLAAAPAVGVVPGRSVERPVGEAASRPDDLLATR